MAQIARLEINDAGSWRVIGKFDNADDEQTANVLNAAEQLAHALWWTGEGPCPKLRVSIDATDEGAAALAVHARLDRCAHRGGGVSEQLFVKRGRRYVPWGNAERYDADALRADTWRMTYCHADGSSRYSYDVRPDTASFVAACELAAHAMECAIADAAVASPSLGGITPYTKAQLALIERFRADMAATGGLVPSHWQHSTAREIAMAGIDAVRAFAQGGGK